MQQDGTRTPVVPKGSGGSVVPSSASPREHLLHDLRRFEEVQRAIANDETETLVPGTEADTWRKKKKKLGEELRKKMVLNRAPAKPKEKLVVSTFGTSPRDPNAWREESGTNSGEERKLYRVPEPPMGVATSIPTAKRWSHQGSHTTTTTTTTTTKQQQRSDDDVMDRDLHTGGGGGGHHVDVGAPSPTAYNPKPVRPHTASAIIGSAKRGPTVIVKGMVLQATGDSSSSSKERAVATSDAKDIGGSNESKRSSKPTPTKGVAPGVSFSRARRFDPVRSASSSSARQHQGGTTSNTSTNIQGISLSSSSARSQSPRNSRKNVPADSTTVATTPRGGSPGPAAYSPRIVERHHPSAKFSTSPRSQQYTLHGNSMFYSSSREQDVTGGVGPGSYSVSGNSGGTGGGVTIPKAPRDGPSSAGTPSQSVASSRPVSARDRRRMLREEETGFTSSENKQESVATTDDTNTIAGRAAKSKLRPSFGTAKKATNIALNGGNIVYQLASKNSVQTPGVGAYRVKDGKTVEEVASTPRPQSARSRSAANKVVDDKSPRSISAANAARIIAKHKQDAITPGPAHYNSVLSGNKGGSGGGVASTNTHNKFLRESQKHWAEARHLTADLEPK